jgi:hypothetical protein
MKGHALVVQTDTECMKTVNYSGFKDNGSKTLPIGKPCKKSWPTAVTAITTTTATQNTNY